MDNLSVNTLAFFGSDVFSTKKRGLRKTKWTQSDFSGSSTIRWGEIGKLKELTYTFTFGKAFLLDSDPDGGAWTLSWIIGGLVTPDRGSIEKNGRSYTIEERRADAWCVRHETAPRFLRWESSVISQIRHGLKATNQIISDIELAERFRLSADRLNRPLKHLSSEAWRASCAIGIAQKKTIFCFPYMPSEYLDQYIWFKELIGLLRDSNALVLLPTKATALTREWCDEVISM